MIILKSDKEVVISGLLDVDVLDLIRVEANFVIFVYLLLFICAEDLMCTSPPQLHQLPGTYFLSTLFPLSFPQGQQEFPTGKIDALDLIPKSFHRFDGMKLIRLSKEISVNQRGPGESIPFVVGCLPVVNWFGSLKRSVRKHLRAGHSW